jgi:hypothetical protein
MELELRVPHADVEYGETEAHGLRLGGHINAVELLEQIQPAIKVNNFFFYCYTVRNGRTII